MGVTSILNAEFKPYIRYADLLHLKQWKTSQRLITDFLLFYVQEGSVQLQVNGSGQLLGPRQFCFIQPGVVHSFEASSPITVMSLHVDLFPAQGGERPPMIVPVASGSTPDVSGIQPNFMRFTDVSIPVVLKPSKPEWLVSRFQKVIEDWNKSNAIHVLQAHQHCIEIIVDILKDHTPYYSVEQSHPSSLSWVPAFMQYHMSQPLTVDEIAKKALMSKSYFTSLFRKQFGTSPHQYLLQMRLAYSNELLCGTTMPLQEISECCGFSSVHHYSKMYKLRYGYPPSERRMPNGKKPF